MGARLVNLRSSADGAMDERYTPAVCPLGREEERSA